ncbi:cupin domain-containing protein [Kribbia dieselivorans]|uniref:cupin domain-containing protein n=1 Tax=Kribbia dieselivorans TaxID=331526 RepID=UPI000838C368|nr:cupin domain-containing protein [Kribbia dieselivorans]
MADHGPNPYITNIETDTLENTNFRDTRWTGEHLQLTLMQIPPGGEIGLEVHHGTDQFLRIEAGTGLCQMGDAEDNLDFERQVKDDDIIMVPSGKWHNVTNNGDEPLKIYSLYGPPDHVHGTVHATKADADNDPNEH